MVDSTGKQYGLINMKKTKSNTNQLLKKKLAIFDESDEEESSQATINQKLQLEAVKTKMRKQTKMEIQRAMEEDPSVFEYDSIYDDMEHKKQEKARMVKIKQRDSKPKYIDGLLKVAKQRNLERERQKERKIQKEREKEGEEFGDKEAFVTASYKKKMQELAEDEERERREAEMDGDVTKDLDLTGFYRHILDQTTGDVGVKDKDTEVIIKRDESQMVTPKEEKPVSKRDERHHDPREEEKPVSKRDERHHDARDTERSRVSDQSYTDVKRERSDRKHQEDKREHRKHGRSHEIYHNRSNDRSHNRANDRSQDKSHDRSSSRSHDRSHDKALTHSTHNRSSEEAGGSIARKSESRSDRDNTNDKKERVSKDKDMDRSSDKVKPEPDKVNEDADSELDISDEEKEDKDKMMEGNELKKSKPAKTEEKAKSEKINKFARRTTNDTVMSARERYMARKLERDSTKLHIVVEDDD